MTQKAVPKFERIAPEARRARLIEASIACLAKRGMQGFTVDNICLEAGTSRGLIRHHFGNKNALLTSIYAAIYAQVMESLDEASQAPQDLDELVDLVFGGPFLDRDRLNVWLALWGEIAVNPALQVEHRKNYALYRERIARAVSAFARARGVTVDSYEVATVLISLVDGLWLEQCIDPGNLSAERAKELCRGVLASILGIAR